MNPQRIVAAIAALAIGFGVTLVGVRVVDDEPETLATADQEEEADSGEEPGVDDDAAEQNEAAADTTPQAEVDEPTPTASSTVAEPPVPLPTTPPQSTRVPVAPTNSAAEEEMDVEEATGTGGYDTPESGVFCLTVVTLPLGSGPTEVVFVDYLDADVLLVLGGSNFLQVLVPSGLALDFSQRDVEFADQRPVGFGAPCSELDDFFEDPRDPVPVPNGTEVDPLGEALDGSVFPCEGIDVFAGAQEVFEAFDYPDGLSSDDTSDLAGYRFLVAAVADRAANGAFLDFLQGVEVTTQRFRASCPFGEVWPEDFEDLVDDFIDQDLSAVDYDNLLCDLGQLSGDSELIGYLDRTVGAFDRINCDYEENG